MNTQSYNIERNVKDDDRGTANGRVLYRALATCATVADFKHFLDTIAKPSNIEANIGVIDAQGGAAMRLKSPLGWILRDNNMTHRLIAAASATIFIFFCYLLGKEISRREDFA